MIFKRLFQKKMVDQDSFTSGPYVAIWVGRHTTDEQLDDYLMSGHFSEEYRFRLDDGRLPECAVEATPKPLRELVHGFSCFEKFQDEFLARAAEMGIAEASSIMAFHFMAYSPEGLPVTKQPKAKFIGNFWFEGF